MFIGCIMASPYPVSRTYPVPRAAFRLHAAGRVHRLRVHPPMRITLASLVRENKVKVRVHTVRLLHSAAAQPTRLYHQTQLARKAELRYFKFRCFFVFFCVSAFFQI